VARTTRRDVEAEMREPTDGLTLRTYADVGTALASTDLSRSIDRDRYEAGSILEAVVLMLDADEHRDRRRVENHLFRRDTLELYERDLFPAIVDRTLDLVLREPAPDLVGIGALLAVALSARTAGVDIDPTSLDERRALVALLRVFAQGISIDASTGDVDAIKADVRDALETFRQRFYQPSLERREAALRAVDGGRVASDELPRDILTTLLQAREALGLPPDRILRETAFFLEAGAHTSSQSLASSLHFIFEASAGDASFPERLRDDPLFVQRCVHEALRLRPTNPLIRRRAVRDTRINDHRLQAGGYVYLDTYAANRDPAVFGPDAADFRPGRAVPATAARYGHSFGGGIHACIGRALAVGYPIRFEGPAPESHLYGLVPLMVRALVARGVGPHPDRPGVSEVNTARWTRWSEYPVAFRVPA
jgi:cytochrome P450